MEFTSPVPGIRKIILLGPNKNYCCVRDGIHAEKPCREPASVMVYYDCKSVPDYFCQSHWDRMREPGELTVREMRMRELQTKQREAASGN